MIAKAKAIGTDHRLLFWFLTAALAGFFFLYVYFVAHSVFDVVHREAALRRSADLAAKVEDLEANYIALKNRVNIEYAYANGFKDISVTKFISRQPLGKSLSLNNEI